MNRTIGLRAALGAALAVLLMGAAVPAAEAETRLLRYPDLHGDRVAFTYAGDLWLAPAGGGVARRLTAHPGLEVFAKFSPDGKWIAFTGQYDGDEQVYVMPTEGGEPRQLTFYPARGPLPDRWGYDHHVYGWTPDSKRVLFRSMRSGWSLVDNRLYTVSIDGGLPTVLPMPRSGAGDFAADGKRIVYSPLFRDFRTWKRYQGGWAQDLYIYDPSGKHLQITDHPRTDRDPMWIGEQVFFASDRDGVLNLYAYDVGSKKTRQVTRHKRFDVRWPSRSDDGRIVYELGGRLQILDTRSGKDRRISIRVPSDGLAARPRRVDASKFIESYGLSPKGKRAVVVARGDVFTVPAQNGDVRNLTHSAGAHDKSAVWSPDGKSIAYISDASGEEEIYLIDQAGAGKPRRLTRKSPGMRYGPRWSPDSRHLACSDQKGRLVVIDAKSGKETLVAQDGSGRLGDYSWSPRGGHLAFSLSGDNGMRSIHIWSRADSKLRRVTADTFHEFEPVWDPAGNYLYYMSDRQFAPQIGSVEWNYVIDRETGIFAVALRKDVKHPFPPKSDEATVASGKSSNAAAGQEGEIRVPAFAASFADDKKPTLAEPPQDEAKKKKRKKKEDKSKTKKEKRKKNRPAKNKRKKKRGDKKSADKKAADDKAKEASGPIKIDFDGLADRVARAPVPDDNYRNLNAIKGHLLFVRGGAFYYGRGSDVRPEVKILSLASGKTATLASSGGYVLSPSGNKLLVRSRGGFSLLDATPAGKASAKPVSTAGLTMTVDPRSEWKQIFQEVWRRYRDFFYADNMHGYDWKALRKQYEPLLKHVRHRSDLNYIIGEMIAELNVGHAYNAGGDLTVPTRPSVALLGAQWELDAKAKRYRIARLLRGHNEEPIYRAPLTEIGVDVRPGDYVLAIDGQPLAAHDNPYQYLQHKANRQITLTVNQKPTAKGARTVRVKPIRSESDLNYLNWVLDNRQRVAKATGGRVGYLHLPNMGAEGIREFVKWYYSQLRKEALIIDVRKNGGGNVSQMVIERLRRTLLATGFSRNNQRPTTYPSTVFHGHLVCLLDENSASDGDIFPAMFKEAGLGPLIGKRSWGGVIGITNRGTLIDGGTIFVPEFGFASKDGRWVIEGYGVDPDIEVDNDPLQVMKGRDQQLERGIAEALKRIKAQPKRLPKRPAPPVKTR